MSAMDRFVKIQKFKAFKMAILFFHILAGFHLFLIFTAEDSQSPDGMFVIFYAIIPAAYWKLIARIKRSEFEKK
jgi:hypothetical protein